MKSSAKKVNLTSVDDLFSTDIKLSRIAGNANTCGGIEDNIKAEILEIAWDCRGFCGDELDSIS